MISGESELQINLGVYRISEANGSQLYEVKAEAKINPTSRKRLSDLRVSVSVGQSKVESAGYEQSPGVFAG